MEQEEYLHQHHLARERAFLYIAMLLITILLTNSWQSLYLFFSGTYGTLNGAATAVETVGMRDYFVGLGVFVSLVAISFYVVYVLRHPKPQLWKAVMPEEEKVPLQSLKEESMLDHKLDRINLEIMELRKKEEFLPSSRKAKKLTKIPTIKEEALGDELRRLTARLQGYRKPMVLQAPLEKTKWDDDLEQVKQQLKNVDKMKIQKVPVRKTAPSMSEIVMTQEKRRLQQELEKVTGMLEKGRKDSSYFIRRYIPSLREMELGKIRKKLQKKGHMPAKELKEIEQKLAQLKK